MKQSESNELNHSVLLARLGCKASGGKSYKRLKSTSTQIGIENAGFTDLGTAFLARAKMVITFSYRIKVQTASNW